MLFLTTVVLKVVPQGNIQLAATLHPKAITSSTMVHVFLPHTAACVGWGLAELLQHLPHLGMKPDAGFVQVGIRAGTILNCGRVTFTSWGSPFAGSQSSRRGKQ